MGSCPLARIAASDAVGPRRGGAASRGASTRRRRGARRQRAPGSSRAHQRTSSRPSISSVSDGPAPLAGASASATSGRAVRPAFPGRRRACAPRPPIGRRRAAASARACPDASFQAPTPAGRPRLAVRQHPRGVITGRRARTRSARVASSSSGRRRRAATNSAQAAAAGPGARAAQRALADSAACRRPRPVLCKEARAGLRTRLRRQPGRRRGL